MGDMLNHSIQINFDLFISLTNNKRTYKTREVVWKYGCSMVHTRKTGLIENILHKF
jgi:hypothetical protein